MALDQAFELCSTFDYIRTERLRQHIDEFRLKYAKKIPEGADIYAGLTDAAPIFSPSQVGKNGKPTFYFLDEPSKEDLSKQAHLTPLGWRLTYGFSEDIYNNNFAFEFPANPDLKPEQVREINARARAHNKDIGLFEQARLACAFDLEQGEALLHIYREGDGDVAYEHLNKKSPNYHGFLSPANAKKEILRVEAINFLDYDVIQVKAFGQSQEYRVSYYTENNSRESFHVHPTRAIRWKSNNINYSQFKGQSNLHACFSHLQIINTIDHAAMAAAHRWGIGIPAIFTKGIRTREQAIKFQRVVGNPTTNSWMQVPTENVVDIKMLGLQGNMLNLAELESMMIDQISAVSGIPRPVLMGEMAGVVTGSEVNERQYFAALDRQHTKQNTLLRQFIGIDPFYDALWEEFGIRDYEINWGLRQVLTEIEKAELEMRTFTNASTMMNFARVKEVRSKVGLPDLEESEDFTEEVCMELYGVSRAEFNQVIPNMGQWKQATTEQIFQTPAEREEVKMEKNLAEQNNPENVRRAKEGAQAGEGGGRESEKRRREVKLQKKLATAGDIKDQLIIDLKKELVNARSEVSTYKISEETGIKRDKLYSLFSYLDKIREKKEKKEDPDEEEEEEEEEEEKDKKKKRSQY
jgi:hypothetical protein